MEAFVVRLVLHLRCFLGGLLVKNFHVILSITVISNRYVITDKGLPGEFEPIEIYRENIDKTFPV